MRQERRKDLETHFCTLEHAWIPAMADGISGRWGTVYEGVAGDTLSTGIFATRERQQLFDAGRFEELAEKFLWPEGYIPTMLSPERYRASSRAVARERVARELARHSDAPNPIGSFCFWNRTRRVTSMPPMSVLSAGARVYCPYLDTDVFSLLASLPGHMLQNEREYHRFHTDTITRAYPEFAHVPYAAKYPTVGRAVGRGHAWRTSAALLWRLARVSGTGLLRRGLLGAGLAYCMANPLYTTRVAELAPSLSYLTISPNSLRPPGRPPIVRRPKDRRSTSRTRQPAAQPSAGAGAARCRGANINANPGRFGLCLAQWRSRSR